MKLPSLSLLREQAFSTLRRFPLVLLVAAIGAALVIADVDQVRSILACVLGLPLLLAIELFGERNGWRQSWRLLAGCCGLALLFLYHAMLPAKLNEGEWIRFLMIDAGLHALVAFAAYARRGEEAGFWQFNQRLFRGFTASALYSATLMIGLMLAIASAKRLFDLDIRLDDAFRDVAAVVFGIFNTWFFLGIVPRDFEELDRSEAYPQGVKVFSQFVLLPLVMVYLAILYLYVLKILLQWRWPNGLVSGPIIGLAVVGILSLLLLYPIRNRDGNRWIAIFSRWFYVAVLPLTAMLVLALWKRISAYGFTESRYISLVTAFWLAGICIYFLIGRRAKIEAIPVSLCILALLASYGPWSAHSVSINDQLARLRRTLEANQILVAGRFRSAPETISSDARDSIQSRMYYLNSRGALESVRAMGHDSTLPRDIYGLLATLGINNYQSVPTEMNFVFELREPDGVLAAGYDYALRFESSTPLPRSPDTLRTSDGQTFFAVLDPARNELQLRLDADTLRFSLDSLVAGLQNEESTHDDSVAKGAGPVKPLVVERADDRWRGRVEIYGLTAQNSSKGGGKRRLSSMHAWILLNEVETGDRAQRPPAR